MCTEKQVDDEHKRCIQYQSKSTSHLTRPVEKKVTVEGVMNDGDKIDDRLDAHTIRHLRESKWLL